MIPRTSVPIGGKEVAALLSILGEDRGIFENDLAAYLSAKKTFAFNSGRTALSVAIQALNLSPGAEVIVPAYTCAIVFEVILRLGLKPVPIDVSPVTYNIDSELIGGAITSRTRVVIPVHLFGRPCEMNQIMELADKHSLYVIEDVAQALGAEYERTKVGTFGDLAIFSFGPGKSITSGEGGAIATNNDELIEQVMDIQAKLENPDLAWDFHVIKNIMAMKLFSNPVLYTYIRNYVKENLDAADREILENCLRLLHQEHSLGLNSTVKLTRMPFSSARIARIQLKKLDEFNRKRITNAMTLNKMLGGLKGYLELPEADDHVKNTFTRYPLKLISGSRDSLIRGLLEEGVDAEKPYTYLIELLESFRTRAPNTMKLANSILNIPNHPKLKESDTLKVANALAKELTRDEIYAD